MDRNRIERIKEIIRFSDFDHIEASVRIYPKEYKQALKELSNERIKHIKLKMSS
jgi:hypothetical protein